MTPAERRLWSALRAGRLHGVRFRRQQPIGQYIVDFYCSAARLVVELDGAHHSDEDTFWYDYHRTKWLQSNGYRVLRFRNVDVLAYAGPIVDTIWEAVAPPTAEGPPSVAPSARQLPPQGGKRWSKSGGKVST